MKYIAFILLLTLVASTTVFAQTYTARQLYDEHSKNSLNFENKYRNKTLTIKGKIRSINPVTTVWRDAPSYHYVNITVTGYENYIVCQIPHADSNIIKPLQVGEEITVTGTVAPKIMDFLFLTNCTFSKTAKVPTPKKGIPEQLPLGQYSVHQADAAGFSFQYTLQIKSYTSYTAYNKSGSCKYDKSSKTLWFTSGPLKGFTGRYVPFNPQNENDPPVLVIDAKGKVPDMSNKFGGYQFAYLQTK